jgi:hypothetical protein
MLSDNRENNACVNSQFVIFPKRWIGQLVEENIWVGHMGLLFCSSETCLQDWSPEIRMENVTWEI